MVWSKSIKLNILLRSEDDRKSDITIKNGRKQVRKDVHAFQENECMEGI